MAKFDIDQTRIVNGAQLSDECFCSICRNLLWKPRTCANCQHLFCEKCIQTWLDSPISQKRCPFRCDPYIDNQCPSSMQLLLSNINIHCQNEEFGCKEILPYDQLEDHQNTQCKYLSQQCPECHKLVLVSKFTEHKKIPGLCIPIPIKCTICQNYIEKNHFRQHFYQCYKQKLTTFNPQLNFFQSKIYTGQLFEKQKRMSQLPTNLKYMDKIQRARERNCSHFYHILIMLKFIALNWFQSPYFICVMTSAGFISVYQIVMQMYSLLCYRTYRQVDRGSLQFLLLSYISYSTILLICQSISDTTIIFFIVLFGLLLGCTLRGPLEMNEMNELINKPIRNIANYCIGLIIIKLILLFIRFYFWLIPKAASIILFYHVHNYMRAIFYRIYTNMNRSTVETQTT